MIYAFKNQSLDEHVKEMLEYWKDIKPRYLHTIIRALNANHVKLSPKEVDEFMKLLVKLHDIGKASEVYQRHILDDKPR